jgi:hypothetical protein
MVVYGNPRSEIRPVGNLTIWFREIRGAAFPKQLIKTSFDSHAGVMNQRKMKNVTEQVANLLRQSKDVVRFPRWSYEPEKNEKRYGAGCKPAPAKMKNVTEQVANLLRQSASDGYWTHNLFMSHPIFFFDLSLLSTES